MKGNWILEIASLVLRVRVLGCFVQNRSTAAAPPILVERASGQL